MKHRPKIYVTSNIPQAGIDELLKTCNVAMWDSSEPVPRGELLNNVKNSEALLCMSSDIIDAEILDAAGPQLSVIGTLSENTSHISVEECGVRGIKVITLPHVSADVVTDLAVALLCMTGSSSQSKCSNSERNGNELEPCNCNIDLTKMTLGLMGFGHVGQGLAQRLQMLKIGRILYEDINTICDETDLDAKSVTFDELLCNSDILCICCKGGDRQTLMNMDAFKKMKKGALLIDAAQEQVINYVDLYEALREKEITAAGLDLRHVKRQIPFKTPLLGLSNCYFLPYKECNATWDKRRQYSETVAKDIVKALRANHNEGDR